MQTLDSFNLTIDTNIFFVIIGIALLIFYTIFIYKYTLPVISKVQKVFLIFVRIIIIVLIFLSIFEPILSIGYKEKIDPIIRVFIDNSSSIASEDSIQRIDKIDRFISELKSININNIRTYLFGNIPHEEKEIENKITLTNRLTNFEKIIDTLISNSISTSAAIILSDGIITDGMNPLNESEKLGFPIFTIGIGDTSTTRDIRIHDVVYNQFLYKDKPTQIELQLINNGFANEKTKIVLFDEGNIVDTKELILSKSGFNKTIFDYIPKTSGEKELIIQINPISSERNKLNNAKKFFLNILENKIQVAVISSQPSADLSIIHQTLKKNSNLKTTLITQVANQMFRDKYSNALVDSANIIFLIDFPSQNTPDLIINHVISELEKGKPFFYLITPRTHLVRLKQFERYLPVAINIANEDLSSNQAEIIKGNFNSIFSKEISDSYLWNSLPPIITNSSTFSLKAESQLLVRSQNKNLQSTNPMFVASSIGNRRAITFLGSDIWRWKLSTYEKNPLFISTLINEIVKWLNISDRSKQLSLRTNKKIYELNEQIEFTAELYNQSFEPVDEADISVAIKNGRTETEIKLSKVKNGLFQGYWEPTTEGNYFIEATAKFDDNVLKSELNRISVANGTVEKQNTQMDQNFLIQLAEITGGKYYPVESINGLIQQISNINSTKSKEKYFYDEIQLWNSEWIMLLIISLFAFEWFYRKRLGML